MSPNLFFSFYVLTSDGSDKNASQDKTGTIRHQLRYVLNNRSMTITKGI